MVSQTVQSFEIFYSYAHEDEALRNQLEKHLATLKWQGLITGWHDRKIAAGAQWSDEIDIHLNSAKIILLLVSSDFIASPYCYGVEVKQAMQRHKNGETHVIPIILRPVDWKGTPFAKLQALPKDAKPVTEWSSLDAAFLDIAKSIRKLVEEGKKDPSTTSTSNTTLSATLQEQGEVEKVSGEHKQRIRERLVYLYHDKKDHIPLIAEDINLNMSNLFSDDITVCCHRICNEAEKQGRLAELIRRVLKDYPYDTELRKLLEIV